MTMSYVMHKEHGFVISVDETDEHGQFIGTMVYIPPRHHTEPILNIPTLGGRNHWRTADFEPCEQPFFDDITGPHIAQDLEDRALGLQRTVDAVCKRLGVPGQPRRKVAYRLIERIDALLELERSVSAWANKQRK